MLQNWSKLIQKSVWKAPWEGLRMQAQILIDLGSEKSKKLVPKSTKFVPKIDPGAVLKRLRIQTDFLIDLGNDFYQFLIPKTIQNLI